MGWIRAGPHPGWDQTYILDPTWLQDSGHRACGDPHGSSHGHRAWLFSRACLSLCVSLWIHCFSSLGLMFMCYVCIDRTPSVASFVITCQALLRPPPPPPLPCLRGNLGPKLGEILLSLVGSQTNKCRSFGHFRTWRVRGQSEGC